MGVLKLFGTLSRSNITSSSIIEDFKEKTLAKHLFLDFNSIIHTSSQQLLSEIKKFIRNAMASLYHRKNFNTDELKNDFKKYKIEGMIPELLKLGNPVLVIKQLTDHFTKRMDKMVILRVIRNILFILNNHCDGNHLETLYMAIDGVPAKGKLIEQRQRKYMGAITEGYNKKLLRKYREYLKSLPNYTYLVNKYPVKWSRVNITPGTSFMGELTKKLHSIKCQDFLKRNFKKMEIIISDMSEVGEGEKKIVNYINKYHDNSDDEMIFYSPDGDVILLCMLLNVKNIKILRYNDQLTSKNGKTVHNLINVKALKHDLGYFVNNFPGFEKENFNFNRIVLDIVCISTLFGDDFVPKIETINVSGDFEDIIRAYLETLIFLKEKKRYLVRKENDKYVLSLTFLKIIFSKLVKLENIFINENMLFSKYINYGKFRNVFNYYKIKPDNIQNIYRNFMSQYEDLKVAIMHNENLQKFLNDTNFIGSLKKTIIIKINNNVVNTTEMSDQKFISTLSQYYRKHNNFPRPQINLNTFSISANDRYHYRNIEGKNEYEIEKYKFEHILDEYYTKFNAKPLDLTCGKIVDYYEKYFDTSVEFENKLTKSGKIVMEKYVEGLLWVFDYYYNNANYLNKWYYSYERAPLLRHVYMYLKEIERSKFEQITDNLSNYVVNDLENYFNPVEQLIYVSPLIPDILVLLPENYREFLESSKNKFLNSFFIDVNKIINLLWSTNKSEEIDCSSIPFFSKCLVKSITKPTESDDKKFLMNIRKVIPTDKSIELSKSTIPDY